jgi:hypothetical protein
MLSSSIVQEIERLLAGGEMSNRAIAAKVGVGKSTVNVIAKGERIPKRRREEVADRHLFRPVSPPQRCVRCGSFVHLPCLICDARLYRAQKSAGCTVPMRSSQQRKRA